MEAPATVESLSEIENLSGFPLPLSATFFPLGFALHLETNSADVTNAAEESWGQFSAEFPNAAPISLSIAVAGSGGATNTGMPAFRSRGHLMTIVWDPDHQIICDFRNRSATGWISPALAADRPRLRRHFLDASVMSLLVQTHLAPVHGALVKRNGRGILLCGESRAGKSTLAFACARAGWQFVCDDGTFLVRDRPGIYGIGNPHTLSLREDVKFLFPELGDRMATFRPGGKLGIEVRTKDLPISLAPGSPIDHLVFLDRVADGEARIEPSNAEDAIAWCAACTVYGEDHVRQAQRRSYRRLLTAGVWRMRYSDLDGAIALLDQLQSMVE